MLPAFSSWNRCVVVKERPSLGNLARLVGGGTPEPVFSTTHAFLRVAPNLVARIDPFDPVDGRTLVRSVTLVLRADYFRANAVIATDEMPRFAVLGMHLPASLRDVVAFLRKRGPIMQSSEPDRWSVTFGGGLKMLFLPRRDEPLIDPGDAVVSSLEFLFGLYEFRDVPVVTLAG